MRLLVVIPLLLLGACHATRETPVAPPAPAAVPADDLLNATLWMQSSVEHDRVLAQTYATAREKLDRVLADAASEALPKGERTSGDAAKLPPAVVVDVDETVLDNSPFQARLIQAGFDFDQAMWEQWCGEAQAKPLPGALEFARYAASRGVTMFYVTNRGLKAKQATEANLRAQGFPMSEREPVVFMAGDPESCAAAGKAKSCRRALIAQHHRIVMLVGDQLSDFIDLPHNTPATRAEASRDYASWFGERWFVLPNPMYGSFEEAITGQLPKGSTREAKRAAKRATLRTD